MPNVQLCRIDASDEPAPCFASDEEIQIADRLRHRLEELYFGTDTMERPVKEDAGTKQ